MLGCFHVVVGLPLMTFLGVICASHWPVTWPNIMQHFFLLIPLGWISLLSVSSPTLPPFLAGPLNLSHISCNCCLSPTGIATFLCPVIQWLGHVPSIGMFTILLIIVFRNTQGLSNGKWVLVLLATIWLLLHQLFLFGTSNLRLQ